MDIAKRVQAQHEFFETGETKKISFRLQALRRIKAWIEENQKDVMDALKRDLGKSKTEAYMSEVGMVLEEIRYQIRHIKKWAKDKRVPTPLSQFPAKSFISREPYGVVLVMAPWNYPFLLCMQPAVGAIAAGNCVVIKPSEYSPHSTAVLKQLVSECCDAGHVCVIEGAVEENKRLLRERFDYIFFTGSTAVGKLVMEQAAKQLTPVTLELGGKSPCLIEESADLRLAARRIAFGKFLNAGQTCVAPDYLLIPERLRDRFIDYLKQAVAMAYGREPLLSEDLPRIINQQHFERLLGLMENQTVILGGKSDRQRMKIQPTVLIDVDKASPVMQEEIFGPVLPVLTYQTLEEAILYIKTKEKPLALYLFTNNKAAEKKILNSCSFGGGCVNDTIIHLASVKLGFGGVGSSGIGSYHGWESFRTFSHARSMVKKARWLDLPFRYPPYTEQKDKMIRSVLK